MASSYFTSYARTLNRIFLARLIDDSMNSRSVNGTVAVPNTNRATVARYSAATLTAPSETESTQFTPMPALAVLGESNSS